MGFATGEDVMNTVESLISELPAALNAQFSLVEKDGDIYPVSKLGSVCDYLYTSSIVRALTLLVENKQRGAPMAQLDGPISSSYL